MHDWSARSVESIIFASAREIGARYTVENHIQKIVVILRAGLTAESSRWSSVESNCFCLSLAKSSVFKIYSSVIVRVCPVLG